MPKHAYFVCRIIAEWKTNTSSERIKKTARQPTHRNWIKKKPHLELEIAADSITEMVL